MCLLSLFLLFPPATLSVDWRKLKGPSTGPTCLLPIHVRFITTLIPFKIYKEQNAPGFSSKTLQSWETDRLTHPSGKAFQSVFLNVWWRYQTHMTLYGFWALTSCQLLWLSHFQSELPECKELEGYLKADIWAHTVAPPAASRGNCEICNNCLLFISN